MFTTSLTTRVQFWSSGVRRKVTTRSCPLTSTCAEWQGARPYAHTIKNSFFKEILTCRLFTSVLGILSGHCSHFSNTTTMVCDKRLFPRSPRYYHSREKQCLSHTVYAACVNTAYSRPGSRFCHGEKQQQTCWKPVTEAHTCSPNTEGKRNLRMSSRPTST